MSKRVLLPGAPRASWGDFPDVEIAWVDEKAVKSHAAYAAAKGGDASAAFRLIDELIRDEYVERVARLCNGVSSVRLTAVHAEESTGRNQIAQAMADVLSEQLQLDIDDQQVQINVVNHTGASGFTRLARQALFGGDVAVGVNYLLVDDFVGQGGTLANFRGYLIANGASVVGATVLTGKPYSARIALSEVTYDQLIEKHSSALETWWQEQFGHGFERLTESEARYLLRSPDADTIRNQIAAARQT